MKMNRREFVGDLTKKGIGLVLLSSVVVVEEACTLESAINEADNILTLIAPLGDGVASVISIADPPIAPAVLAASGIYDAAVKAVENFLSDWATATAAAQPGILSETQTAVQVLNQDASNLIAASQVKDPTTAAEIGSITAAITDEISALLKVIPQIGAMGGTTAAARRLFLSKHVNLYSHRSAKSWRSVLVHQLETPTKTAIDGPRSELAAKLNKLSLK